MALACRLIILMLLYLAYVLKRDLTQRALKDKRPRLLHFHTYVVFSCCLVSGILHILLFCGLRWRLYCAAVVLTSWPVVYDEYMEIQWLKERQHFYRTQWQEQEDDEGGVILGLHMGDIEMRSSLYYSVFKWIQTKCYRTTGTVIATPNTTTIAVNGIV